MRRYIPAAAAAAIMLVSFLVSPPTGEFIVALPWQAFFTLFMVSTAAQGLIRENAYAPLERAASSIQYTISAIGFIAFCAFITAPFLTAFYSALAFIGISDRVLDRADRKQHKAISAAIVSAAAYSGAMLLPAASAQNILVSSLYGVSTISTMYPAVMLSIPLLAVSVFLAVIKKPKDRIYIHEQSSEEPGNRSLTMFHICLLAVVALSASDIFYWFDLLIVFLAVVIIFDRKILLKTDYPLLLSFFFIMAAAKAFASSPAIAQIFMKLMEAHPVIIPYAVSAFTGPAAASALLADAASSPELLLLSSNLGGMVLVSSSSAVLLMKGEGKQSILLRIAIGSAMSMIILSILAISKHLPV